MSCLDLPHGFLRCSDDYIGYFSHEHAFPFMLAGSHIESGWIKSISSQRLEVCAGRAISIPFASHHGEVFEGHWAGRLFQRHLLDHGGVPSIRIFDIPDARYIPIHKYRGSIFMNGCEVSQDTLL